MYAEVLIGKSFSNATAVIIVPILHVAFFSKDASCLYPFLLKSNSCLPEIPKLQAMF